MRVINQETWRRKSHFDLYNSMAFPHIGISVQIDITNLWSSRSQFRSSPTITLVYLLTKSANQVPELRQRIQDQQVIEYDIVHATLAVLGEDNTFGVCNIAYHPDFSDFAAAAEICIENTKKNPSMDDFHIDREGNIIRYDILDMTVIPWLSFTSFDLTRLPQIDSVPLLAWGKVFKQNDQYLLPFFVNFHHALVDGLHVAQYVKIIEDEAKELSEVFI